MTEFGFDSWSDDEDVEDAQVEQLQQQLAAAQTLLQSTMQEELPKAETKRDDDTHYFDSYAENGEILSSPADQTSTRS